ncbi:hypothetical protein B9J09_08365 [Xylella fastidiosa subsp. pauca]|uniref:DUF1249 domain-containing protein n=1 Tax=Xylella fastidiosa TaxID=2371 RepID=UPI000583E138|nr:DUF1249 domain-containing protein [Xylella fastidiosa]ARO69038.1 hypothetical protein B9J09_08365 [Xylella fastidiosa subsp. pauca]AVI21091.1 hypothetical protein BCV75_07820 [Xylella fastidiosa]AVI23116.1 hypothetical protein BC375_07885 [Xylella fastidiosa]KIA58061.1 hypothetical protein RA12_05840 [Xylella fastidiosa]KXB10018.1 hypothetical protein ADT32_09865 [Xylella fastidiosa]
MLNDMMLHQRIPRLSRLSWLMALYAENYRHLKRLFAPGDLEKGSYVSVIGDGLDLCLDVIERHRYTVDLRLTYELCDPMTGEPDPSAYVRLYCDALQVETTHCYVGRRWQDVIGLSPLPGELMHYRMRMNIFLGKWLDYLAERGHGVATLCAIGRSHRVCRVMRG